MAYSYDYPRPALTVDCVVFGWDAQRSLQVLLIRRNLPPFQKEWALPGGFVQMAETLEDAARRELREETGIDRIFLEQLYTFGAVERDPRDRVITVAYYALINLSDHALAAQTDAEEAKWYAIDDLPNLAFDHGEVFQMALKRLQGKLRYEPIGFELLPQKFTLSQLQALYETVLGYALDKRNFRKKLLKMDLLTALEEWQTGVAHRAARLYSFDAQKYRQLQQEGFSFDL